MSSDDYFNNSQNSSHDGGPAAGAGAPMWTLFKILIELICFSFGIIGIIGNSIVVTVYVRKVHKKATEILILCLSCLDLVYCICSDVIQVVVILIESYPPSMEVNILITVLMNFLFTSIPYMSWLMILNITCNRYIAVCHPFRYQQIYTLRFAKNVVLSILTVSVLIGTPTLLIEHSAVERVLHKDRLFGAYQKMRAGLVVIVCTSMFLMYSRLVPLQLPLAP